MKVTLVSNESHIGCQMKVTLDVKWKSHWKVVKVIC